MARPRTWTDEQLRIAVHNAKTWAEVSRRLNLPARGKTTLRLRGHAARLGLDTSHIPVRTQVAAITSPSPEPYERLAVDIEELREAVIASRSWSQVAERLRVSRTGRNYANLKALAARAEIDVSGLYGQAWGRAPLEPLPVPFSKPFDPALLYQMGTAVATAWFIGRGYMVSVPAEPAAYDLVVESDLGLQRVQVKTTRGATVGITKVQYGLTESPSSGKYGGRRPYTKAEIDLFFIFTGTGAMYLIPIDAVEGMRHLAVGRYAKYRLPELTGCSYSNVAERSARDAGC
jgi:hypothetical protein